MLLAKLNEALANKREQVETKTYTYLHEIADKIKRRSMVFLFTDMFQSDLEEEKLFEALQHLKYNKHEVILFHTYDKEKEIEFNFNNRPKRFVDVETGVHVIFMPIQLELIMKKPLKIILKSLKHVVVNIGLSMFLLLLMKILAPF